MSIPCSQGAPRCYQPGRRLQAGPVLLGGVMIERLLFINNKHIFFELKIHSPSCSGQYTRGPGAWATSLLYYMRYAI